MGRKGWRKLCPGPAYFIVSRETGKLSYHWKHTYSLAESGPDKGAVVNPDTGTMVPSQDGGQLTRLDSAALKHSETVSRSKDGTAVFSALWQADRDKIQRMAPLGYISRYMKGWWDYAIADEMHQLAQETAQGNKFSGEGIHSLESDDDMMSAMARELVERGRVGESADAVWADLKRERAQHMPPMPVVSQTAPAEQGDQSLPFLPLEAVILSSSALHFVESSPNRQQQASALCPTGHTEGEQMLLFA
jgi:hypothetical protein